MRHGSFGGWCRAGCVAALVLVAVPAMAASERAGKWNGAWSRCVESLDDFQIIRDRIDRRRSGVNPSAFVKDLRKTRTAYRSRMRKAVATKTPAGMTAARDLALVYSAQGLRGMNLVLEGIRDGDDEEQSKGWDFVEWSTDDLRSVTAGTSSAAGASGRAGGAEGPKPGASVGGNFSAIFMDGSRSVNISFNGTRPWTRKIDYGVGVNLGFSGSDGTGGSTSTTIVFGYDLSLRYNFIGAFRNNPWVVPYTGVQLGQNLNRGAGTGQSSVWGKTVRGGIQGGMLFYFSRRTALNVQALLDFTSTDPDMSVTTDTITTATQFTLSLGLRMVL